ncbi:MAG: orotidine-5'-phosphate decarboxylase [Candidatus Omnitrophica bacterium]|nr:orotidine-5'-phosphate decarboxylase [Candidatus Omnitrophota bacterium]MDD5429457.1 orotidine-5'-phosphate decarboxylase [Candidatus Omnitrophota bacterium]
MLKWKKLIVALDLEDKGKIYNAVRKLSPKGVKFKIGSIAFTKFGPALVKTIIGKGIDVFLDLKLYDIPNTMKEASKTYVQMGCWAFTVHIKSGPKALREVKKEITAAARKLKVRRPLVLGVTELTSEAADRKSVLSLARAAKACGLDGVIASAKEAALIKRNCKLKVITPGIRAPEGARGDQRRVATANFAFAQGADYVVVGRPIISQKDYLKAAKGILAS